MNTTDFAQSYRATFIFIIICFLCVLSLITDTSTVPIQSWIKKGIYIITTPLVLTKSKITTGINLIIDSIFEPDYLRAENATLKEEVQRLRLALLARAEKENQIRQEEKIAEVMDSWSKLKLLHAKVLEIYQGAIRVDKGTQDGVQVSQGVIVPEGVVGIIIETTPSTSVIATLHHRECRVGAMIQRFRLRAYDGVIYPSGDLKKICTMNYIDINDEVRVGDLVVTSPESIFPPGMPIGTIQAIHEKGTLWKSADLLPAVDPYKLDSVFIIVEEVIPQEVTHINREEGIMNEILSNPEVKQPIQEILAP